MFKKIAVILLMATICVGADAFSTNVFAKGGRGGGGRSSRSSRPSRPSRPSSKVTKPNSRTAKPKRPTISNKKQFTQKKAAHTKKVTKYNKDKILYDKAKKNGTSFKTRKAASADFKKKNAGKFPSKYTSKPSARPSHIPASTKGANGNTYNVTYNQGHGGYGYMGVGGRWMAYSAMGDIVMMSMLMNRGGYHYGAAPMHPGAAPMYAAPWNPLIVIMWILIACVIIGAIVWGITKLGDNNI